MIVVEEVGNMVKQKLEDLEQKRIELFKIRDVLLKEKRNLIKKREEQKEKLGIELELEKEFIVMSNNLNLGRGKYYELSNLPYEISEYMLSDEYKELSKQERDKVKAKLEFAKQISHEIEEEYDRLIDTRLNRLQKIKNYKRTIQSIKKQLCKNEKEERKKIIKAKRLDRKIEYLNDKKGSNNVIFKIK